MKKVLLIGKNGQLGSQLAKDASVFGLEMFPFDKEELNITDFAKVKENIEKIKPDIVINTAAYQVISLCEQNPLAAMAVNFIAVANLARICKEHHSMFVTYSSDYVFDGTKGSPNGEDDAPSPLQMYGLSKLAGEYAALQVHPDGAFVIRTCGIYGGKKGSPEKGNFVLNIMKEAQDKPAPAKASAGEEVIEVSCEQIVSPTYAVDLSRSTLQLITGGANPGIYHLVNEGVCSWYEFAKEIFTLANIDKELKPKDRSGQGFADSINRPIFSALKNTKAKALGIQLPSWKEGLSTYFNFLKE